MLSDDVQSLLRHIDQIASLSDPFRFAVEAGRTEEAREISERAGTAIAQLAFGMRRLQDAGRCPKETRSVGLWIKDATETMCATAISNKKIMSGDQLPLREVLNKFVHVTASAFRFDPNHRMVLVGKLGGKLWIVDFAINDFCSAARDALYETEPAD